MRNSDTVQGQDVPLSVRRRTTRRIGMVPQLWKDFRETYRFGGQIIISERVMWCTMVVKSKRGRRRYIAFTVDGSLTKETLIARFRTSDLPFEPRVVQCSEGWCIIRCGPKEREDAIAIMKAVDPKSTSLCTSGTVVTLRNRYPELMRLRPPPKRR